MSKPKLIAKGTEIYSVETTENGLELETYVYDFKHILQYVQTPVLIEREVNTVVERINSDLNCHSEE